MGKMADLNAITSLHSRATRASKSVDDSTSPSRFGWTCMHLAAREGHIEAVRTLLDHSTEWMMSDTSALDALCLAVFGGQRLSCYQLGFRAMSPMPQVRINKIGPISAEFGTLFFRRIHMPQSLAILELPQPDD
ncbi:hypothetical protein BKA67DRAFT_541753 [Truncatella angustata]|uniref:ANK_REP_REGION domain-containing protein n=1 Tax=Truncatella angustata TaxID=152316 RepID=A0A9P8UB52_9PEZI|nr:uncharacterized protein BKA67DRAFT_541753 [Truncatella angustata]KAH6645542.1 hypothetical protein BKA67DRAFT_541753 [Truncatella angustata]